MPRRSRPLLTARLRAQVVKEVLSILRDPRSRMVVFAPPLIQLLIFSFAATLEVSNVDIAVHDQDSGRWSHELVARLDGAGFVSRVHPVGSGRELRRLIDRGEVIAALAIPPDFSREIAAGGTGRVQVLIDGRRSNAGQSARAITFCSSILVRLSPSAARAARVRSRTVC
jgi:ABC-2 type transport system permease protein